MRPALLSLLTFSLLIACQSADVGPARLLYRTWELPSTSGTGQLITFQTNGQVRYGINQDEAGCCQPNQVKSVNNQLTFSIIYGNVDCSLVYCAPSSLITNSPWTVTSLTTSELTIMSNGQSFSLKAR